jgi:hypothetical protein
VRHAESQAVRKHLRLLLSHAASPNLRDRAVTSGKRFLETVEDRHVQCALRCLLGNARDESVRADSEQLSAGLSYFYEFIINC